MPPFLVFGSQAQRYLSCRLDAMPAFVTVTYVGPRRDVFWAVRA